MAQLGKYQLVAEIARGGMGIVFLAVARGPARFSKLLVVKQLKPELVEDSNFLEMFLEEARLAARLSHPNIVQTYEVGSDDNRHFMVMDYLEGVTLARIIRRKDPAFTLPMHLRVICEALQGLHYAHTLSNFDGSPLGIVHRDATPQNIFVTYDGQVKVVDFGIAKALDSTVETNTGVLKGKPSYMAPEQISGDVDPRADVFTAGVLVWEAIAGRRMWEKRNDIEILTNIIKGEVPSLKQACPDTPPALLRIVAKALTKSRDERYGSAAALQEDLENYLTTAAPGVTVRDVGRVATQLFATERTAVKSMIETHLAGLSTGKEHTKLPSLRPPRMLEASGDNGAVVERSTPSMTGTSGSKSSESSLTSNTSSSIGRTPAGTELPAPSTAAPLGGITNRSLFIATGLMLGVIVATGVAISALRRGERPAVAAAMPAEAPAPPPEVRVIGGEPASPATHDVTVRAFPKGAVLTIDGAEVGNPVKKACSHGKPFAVHASSPGHVSVDRTLACEQDESIEIALTAQPLSYAPPPAAPATKPGATRPASGAPAPPRADAPPRPASAADVNPSGGTKPNRPIDTSSPYNQ